MGEARVPRYRLAIVGCGSVAERFHAPALRGFTGFLPTVMVDHQPARARLLADSFPGSAAESDFTQLAGRVDAAIVALPSHLNAPVAMKLLEMGISVLVEKPAALTVEAARALAAAEVSGKARFAVGFIRREAVAVRMAKEFLQNGMLGEIKEFSIEDGYPFDWNAVNEFRFDKTRGGGILLDIGSHVLDMASYWFGGVSIKRFADDNSGGVETNVQIDIEAGNGVPGTLELSWNRVLRNSARLVGTHGTLEIEWYNNRVTLELANHLQIISGAVRTDAKLGGGAESFHAMFLAQLQRWHGRLQSGGTATSAMAGAAEALLNVELIAQCREMKVELELPWRNGAQLLAR